MPIPLIFVKNVQTLFKVYCKYMADQQHKCNKNALIHAMKVGEGSVVCQFFSSIALMKREWPNAYWSGTNKIKTRDSDISIMVVIRQRERFLELRNKLAAASEMGKLYQMPSDKSKAWENTNNR